MPERDGHRQIPCPGLTLRISMARRRIARHLVGDVLALDTRLVAKRQHDGADHRDEQHETRRLEVEDIFRVEDAAQRLGIGDAAWRRSAR